MQRPPRLSSLQEIPSSKARFDVWPPLEVHRMSPTTSFELTNERAQASLERKEYVAALTNLRVMHYSSTIQPFSQNSLTATVPKVFQIGLCAVVEADLELFWNS